MSIWSDALEACLGDRLAAATDIAARLMSGDPATFKQGYTADNAVIAVADLAKRSGGELTADELAELKRRLAEK